MSKRDQHDSKRLHYLIYPTLLLQILRLLSATQCTHGDLRLVGGYTDYEGRVEVCIDGYWRTVCDNDFDDGDALVVCRQLFGDSIGTQYVFC